MPTPNKVAVLGFDRAMRDVGQDARDLTASVRTLRSQRTRGNKPIHELIGTLTEQQIAADGIRIALAEAARRLVVLTDAEHDEMRFGRLGWPDRLRELRHEFEIAPMPAARRWLATWTDALLAGRFDDAVRLTSVPFAFPPELGWLQDRCIAGLDAIQIISPSRWATLGTFLTQGATFGGEATLDLKQRSGLMVMEARMRALAEMPGAIRLLEDAALLAPSTHVEIVAATKMVERLGRRSVVEETDASPSDRERSEAGSAERTSADGEPSSNELPAVVEWLQLAKEDASDRDLMPEAYRAVSALPSVVGAIGRIDALLERAPDELWVAIGERLRRDGLLDDALVALERVELSTPNVEAEKANVFAAMSADVGDPPSARADYLFEAGRTAIMADRVEDSIAAYEAARLQVHDHIAATYGLADALRVSVSTAPFGQARAQLERALGLCDEADVLNRDGEEAPWGLLVETDVAGRLGQAASEARSEALWRSVCAAGRAIAFDPSPEAWLALSAILHTLSCTRTAELTSRFAEALAPLSDTVLGRRIDALTYRGRTKEAREILDEPRTTEVFGGSWVDANRARAELFAGELGDAVGHINAVLAENPEDAWSREIRAQILTVRRETSGAREDWEWVWRHAALDEFYGLVAAAWGALGQELIRSAHDLALELIPVERASVDDGDGHTVLGISSLLLGDASGWDHLRTAIGTADTYNIGYMRNRIRAILGDRAINVDRLDTDFEQRAAELESSDQMPPMEQVAEEMRRVLEQFSGDTPTDLMARRGARLTRALYRYHASDADSLVELRDLAEETAWPELAGLLDRLDDFAEPVEIPPAATENLPDGTEPDDWVNMFIELPPSWDDRASTLADVHLPDLLSIAFNRRRSIPERFALSSGQDLEPNQYRIGLQSGRIVQGNVPPGVWYCRRDWLSAIPEESRMAIGSTSVSKHLVTVPTPADDDFTTRVIAWSPLELIARRATGLVAVATRQTTPSRTSARVIADPLLEGQR